MNKSLRLSEKWFRRGLWVVALVFANFLIGLGSTIVGDLPRVERNLQLESFVDQAAAKPLREAVREATAVEEVANRELDQAELRLDIARQTSRNAQETFQNWIATRRATQQPEQDAELILRTKALESLKAGEDAARAKVDAQRQIVLDAQQARQQAASQAAVLEDEARVRLLAEQQRQELRVFGYRLLLTLPLLGAAGWLFVKQRKSIWWPFVWGFIIFAVFAFFVELVPYLPSYGGYVHYIVGIGVTVLVGRYAIIALNRYLARQKLAEQQPERVRRDELSYDTALARLAKGACPGCERPVDLKNVEIDYCPHCGIGLFDYCAHCDARKSAFAKFCHACGTVGHVEPEEMPFQGEDEDAVEQADVAQPLEAPETAAEPMPDLSVPPGAAPLPA